MLRLSIADLDVLCAACQRDRAPESQQVREFAATVLHGVLIYPQSSIINVTRGRMRPR